MPIYEYQCTVCGHEFEAMQKMSEDVLKDCPECAKPELKKLMSAVGFQLKGSGWYATDFKESGKKPEKKEQAKPESKPESKPKASGGCGSGGCGCH